VRKLTTLTFIFLSDIKDMNQTALRFITQDLDRNQGTQGRPQKISQGSNVEILLIRFGLLTMQCKWTFANRCPFLDH